MTENSFVCLRLDNMSYTFKYLILFKLKLKYNNWSNNLLVQASCKHNFQINECALLLVLFVLVTCKTVWPNVLRKLGNKFLSAKNKKTKTNGNNVKRPLSARNQ